MAEDRLKTWEILFQRALLLIDSVTAAGGVLDEWSFGGGTVLMRRHNHRFSKDIDIFVPDPQCLGFFSPRLSTLAESMTSDYIEQSRFIKLHFPEGEIDFVAAGTLTKAPTVTETLFDHEVPVEKSTEIVAKKLWYRGQDFTARDIFDLAMVIEKEPQALPEIRPILLERRTVILDRIAQHQKELREDFEELETLEYRPSFDECIERVTRTLNAAGEQ